MNEKTIPAESFCQTLAVNVDNPKLSDEAFRELVRNTLTIVKFEKPHRAVRYHTTTDDQTDEIIRQYGMDH